MFDSLLNTKFYNKCKHAFKCIRTRMGPIRRKKHAMIRFLKKDVADLLANGLDTHAFGRMDGLIAELNHSACYDMIEQFCDEIGKQLGSLQKQRECPPETREAVSTLIFAAAHFPDLPELCDLRHIFTERYDNFVEHFVSLEFVQKLETKEFTNEEKIQVMKSIAEELSVSFDAKKLKLKLWATSQTEHDMLGKGLRKEVESAMPSSNKQKCDKDAPSERKEKDIIEKVVRKPVERPMPSPNMQNCELQFQATPASHNKKVAIPQINSANAQAVPDGIGRSDENSMKHQSEKSEEKEHLEKPVSSWDTKRRYTLKDVKKVNRKDDRPSEKELMEAVELDLNGLPKQRIVAAKFPETESNKVDEFNAKPKKSVKEHHIEKENKESPHYRSRMPGGLDHDGRHAESNLRAQDTENKGRPVTPPNGNTRNKVPPYAKQNGANMKNHMEKQANNGFLSDSPQPLVDPGHPIQKGRGVTVRPVTPPNGNTRNKVPPYAKQNGANTKNHIEKQANNGFLNDRPQHLVDPGHPVQKGQGVTERPANMRPPYVKPKSNIQTVNGESEKHTPKDCSKHNIPGQAEHLVDKDVLRPVSVRRRNAKLPAAVDSCDEAPIKEKVTSQTPSSHKRHTSRKNAADLDHSGSGTDGAIGIGKNVQRTPSSEPKHTGRNGAMCHNKDYGGFMRHRQPEEDATAIDFGNLLPHHASSQRRHNNGCNGDLDEEERMMDKLLMHYSRKGLDPTNKNANDGEAQTDRQQVVSLHPPGRAISLPPVSVGPGEEVKVPARSTSLHPDCPRAVRVHPRMPDFDELAARVNALRNA